MEELFGHRLPNILYNHCIQKGCGKLLGQFQHHNLDGAQQKTIRESLLSLQKETP